MLILGARLIARIGNIMIINRGEGERERVAGEAEKGGVMRSRECEERKEIWLEKNGSLEGKRGMLCFNFNIISSTSITPSGALNKMGFAESNYNIM